MEITVTVTSLYLSLIFNASSRALLSSWLRIDGTPSLINVPVAGLILITFVSGTCFAQTIILNAISILLLPYFLKVLPAITIL